MTPFPPGDITPEERLINIEQSIKNSGTNFFIRNAMGYSRSQFKMYMDNLQRLVDENDRRNLE